MTPTGETKPTAESVYETIASLPSVEQLQLATLILNRISPQIIAENEEDEVADLRLMPQASMRYASQSFGKEEDDTDATEAR